jgi:hypothetical protein
MSFSLFKVIAIKKEKKKELKIYKKYLNKNKSIYETIYKYFYFINNLKLN